MSTSFALDVEYDWVAVDLAVEGHLPHTSLRRADRDEAVRRLHEMGLTDLQIGARLGIHDRQVFRIRHDRLGLPPVTVRGRNAKATTR
jgi:hypothetical protein